MTKKYKILLSITVVLFLLLAAIPADTKGMEETVVWDITFKGTGTEPFFRSSVTMELDLKGTDTKDDINIFINRQKWEGEWDYEQSLKMTFYEEGNYEIHLVHKNGYEETRKITVELNNPSVPKIKSGSYSEGKWTSQNILLEAYGTKAVSKISHYEYRTGESEWKSMKKGMLEMKQDMDDIVLVRAVSNAGRYSEVQKIWCRLWKRNPNLSRITCSEKSRNGWYQKIPEFTYESEQTEGPVIHTYARLTQLQTGQTQTEIDKIPKIKKDGKYQLKVWTKDEAGNRSENSFYTTCFVDTKKPEIFIEYKNKIQEISKYQRAKIRIKDQNILRKSMKIMTSGKQIKGWSRSGEYYESEVVFDHDGQHNLSVTAEDMAGNISIREEKTLKIDTKKPEIQISGIQNGKSYKTPVSIKLQVKDENSNMKKTKVYLNGKRWNFDQLKEDGYYLLRVEAEDLAGNQSVVIKKFTINKKGVQIHFLQEKLEGKDVSQKNLRPGFHIASLEPVQVTGFLVNGQKVPYEWKGDKVYMKQPVTLNGKYCINLNVTDANGLHVSSKKITFMYDTKQPVIQLRGLNAKNECDYGTTIFISLENQKDYWTKIKLDKRNIADLKSKISLKNLEPGVHVLKLEARDAAGNTTKEKIKFEVTKILPDPVKKIVKKDQKREGNVNKKDEKTEVILWIAAGMILVISAAGLIYRKHSK